MTKLNCGSSLPSNLLKQLLPIMYVHKVLVLLVGVPCLSASLPQGFRSICFLSHSLLDKCLHVHLLPVAGRLLSPRFPSPPSFLLHAHPAHFVHSSFSYILSLSTPTQTHKHSSQHPPTRGHPNTMAATASPARSSPSAPSAADRSQAPAAAPPRHSRRSRFQRLAEEAEELLSRAKAGKSNNK